MNLSPAMLLLYVPVLRSAFRTLSLEPVAWAMMELCPVVVVGADGARNAAFRRWVW